MKGLHAIALLLVLGGLAASVLAGCGSARRGAPLQPAIEVTDPHLLEGRRVFLRFCQHCHPGGEGGLGPSLNDKPLPGFLIRFQVRNGLGAMPSFGPELISPEEIDALVAYVVAIRRHDG